MTIRQHFLLLFLSYLLSNLEINAVAIGSHGRERIPANVTITCEYLHRETSDVWLIGEVMDGSPFAAQLLAVYSYAPIALIVVAHLVAGDMSVHEPVVVHPQTKIVQQWKLARKPFAEFFDLEKFTTYFQRHRLHIISQQKYDSCFATSQARKKKLFPHQLIELKRIPEFLPYTRRQFHMILYMTNLSNIKAKKVFFPFSNHHQVRFLSRYKMTGLYSFWNDTTMTNYVAKSLHPAPALLKAADDLFKLLKMNYLAVHVRLDDEGWDRIARSKWGVQTFSDHHEEEKILNGIVAAIKESECFKSYYQKHSLPEKPLLYLFTNRLVNDPVATDRFYRLVQLLRKANIARLFVRSSSLQYLSRQTSPPKVTSNSPDLTILDPPSLQGFTPEQLTYIDMIVSRKSKCFITSPVPSLTSYLIARQRQLDLKIIEKYTEVTPETYGESYYYRDWGF